MKKVLATLLCFFSVAAFAAKPDAVTDSEVKQLLTKLETSGCQFNRNGTWYKATEAKSHLSKKYDYLVNKGWVSNAESFIARGAAKSSMSGKAYQVKCDAQAAVPSGTWLTEALKQIRQMQNPL